VSALKLHEEKHSAACKCLSVTGDKMRFSTIHYHNCLLCKCIYWTGCCWLFIPESFDGVDMFT